MTRPTLAHFKKEILKDPECLKLYEDLEPEYQLTRELLHARKRAHLTQQQVAEGMGTQKSNVARLENLITTSKPSPTFETLQKYAKAVNCRLEIHLVPQHYRKNDSSDCQKDA
jgi:transcriptional regulator with XRE-family HTH domain